MESLRKYRTVGILGWQDAMIYRVGALLWVAYAVLPVLTLMLVWIAAYQNTGANAKLGGYDLGQMMTYYLCVTLLRVAITPHPEWDISQAIRDGKITQFIVKPIGYYGYRVSQETSYQIIKTGMFLPGFALMVWGFRAYWHLPPFDLKRTLFFIASVLLAYALLTQLKFLLGISAFWISEPGGFMEIYNVLSTVLGGALIPLTLLPFWLRHICDWLPFAILYDFPLQILQARATPEVLLWGFTRQIGWLILFSILVRVGWKRGLLAYEAYGG